MKIRAGADRRGTPFLTTNKEYVVFGLDHDSFRVLNDRGEPVLVPRSRVDVVDDTIPDDWAWTRYSLDEFYADPACLSAPGFYERYWDRESEAVEQLESYLKNEGIL